MAFKRFISRPGTKVNKAWSKAGEDRRVWIIDPVTKEPRTLYRISPNRPTGALSIKGLSVGVIWSTEKTGIRIKGKGKYLPFLADLWKVDQATLADKGILCKVEGAEYVPLDSPGADA